MTIQEEVLRLAEAVPREPGTLLPPGATDVDVFVMLQEVEVPPEVRDRPRFANGPKIGFVGIRTSRG